MWQVHLDEDHPEPLRSIMAARRQFGIDKYGQPLMTFDGRDTLQDALEEALDLVAYLSKYMIENAPAPRNHPIVQAYFHATDALMLISEFRHHPNPDVGGHVPDVTVAPRRSEDGQEDG